MNFRRLTSLGIAFALTLSSACSLSSLPTLDGLAGAAAGAVVGGGIGSIIGDHTGKKTENTLMVGAIGAATGLGIGALINDNRMELAQEDAQVIREAQQLDSRQKEIDGIRAAVNSDSSWGRAEVKPWQERYLTETSDLPYEGQGLPY